MRKSTRGQDSVSRRRSSIISRKARSDDWQPLTGEVLALKPETQFAPGAWRGFQKANAGVPLFVLPGNLTAKLHREPGTWQHKIYANWTPTVVRALHAYANAALTEIHQVSALADLANVGKRYGHIQGFAMVAQPLVQNHVSRRRQSEDGLL